MRKLILRLIELELIMKRVKIRAETKGLIQISHALLQRPSLSSKSKPQVVQCLTNQQKPWIIRRYLALLKYINRAIHINKANEKSGERIMQ